MTDESIQSKGGKARAAAMSKEELTERARNAAYARHEKTSPIPKATHEGTLEIVPGGIPAAVLDNKTRLLTQQGFLMAIGRARSAKGGQGSTVDEVIPFLAANNLKQFITNELLESTKPIRFRTTDGRPAFGYNALLLPMVCEVYLKLRDSYQKQDPPKPVPANQSHIVDRCDILMRSLARVGIIALVDEATGYQYDRPRKDLEEQLKKFISEQLRGYVQTFPAEYFKHLCRLRGVELRADMKLPSYFGTLTNNLVYKRIAPGLLRKLKETKQERGSRSNKLFSWLSEDVGLRGLLVHLGLVIGAMKSYNDYAQFEKHLDAIAPIYPEVPGLFDNPKDWEVPT